MKRYLITVSGNVQRVGFRNYASKVAVDLGLTGKAVYVDQDIKIEAEGKSEPLQQFIAWCKTGPSGCNIDDFNFQELPVKGDKTFEVVHGLVFSR